MVMSMLTLFSLSLIMFTNFQSKMNSLTLRLKISCLHVLNKRGLVAFFLVSLFLITEVALMMLGVFEIRTFKLISTDKCSLLIHFQYLKRTTISNGASIILPTELMF